RGTRSPRGAREVSRRDRRRDRLELGVLRLAPPDTGPRRVLRADARRGDGVVVPGRGALLHDRGARQGAAGNRDRRGREYVTDRVGGHWRIRHDRAVPERSLVLGGRGSYIILGMPALRTASRTIALAAIAFLFLLSASALHADATSVTVNL